MAAVRQYLTHASENMRRAFSLSQSVSETIASLTTGVSSRPLPESAERVSQAAKLATTEAKRILKAALAAEASAEAAKVAATRAVAAVAAAERAKAAAAEKAKQAARMAAEAEEDGAVAAQAVELAAAAAAALGVGETCVIVGGVECCCSSRTCLFRLLRADAAVRHYRCDRTWG